MLCSTGTFEKQTLAINIIIIIMTIFNEETFSLKSGLQKGPRRLKIKNLQ